MNKTKKTMFVSAFLFVFFAATASIADIDLFSGQRIASAGDWRFEYRDALVMFPDGGVMVFEDACSLTTGSENTWLSLGFWGGWVNVTIYASVWDHPSRSRAIQMVSGGQGILMNDATFSGEFIQTSLPANENPERSVRLLAEQAGQGSIEVMRMPGSQLLVTFSGRGLSNLLDRAIACGHASRN